MDHIPFKFEQGESAKPSEGISDQATMLENHQHVLCIDRVSTLIAEEECLEA